MRGNYIERAVLGARTYGIWMTANVNVEADAWMVHWTTAFGGVTARENFQVCMSCAEKKDLFMMFIVKALTTERLPRSLEAVCILIPDSRSADPNQDRSDNEGHLRLSSPYH